MNECCDNHHPDHSGEIKSLNRLAGQIEGVKKMIEDRRYCPDIVVQLRAVQAAAKSIEANLLKTHLESCVADAFERQNKAEAKQKIEELITLFKKLD